MFHYKKTENSLCDLSLISKFLNLLLLMIRILRIIILLIFFFLGTRIKFNIISYHGPNSEEIKKNRYIEKDRSYKLIPYICVCPKKIR